MNCFSQLAARLAILGLLSILAATSVFGEAQSVEVSIRHKIEPAKVIGMLISSTRVINKSDIQVRTLGDGTIVVSIPFESGELDDDSVATAMAVTADGAKYFADVKPIVLPSIRKSFLTLPACPESTAITSNLGSAYVISGLGYLEQLIANRAKQRIQVQGRIKEMMTEEFLAVLKKGEEVLGLEFSEPLSPDLKPLELEQRLFRLATALENYTKRQTE